MAMLWIYWAWRSCFGGISPNNNMEVQPSPMTFTFFPLTLKSMAESPLYGKLLACVFPPFHDFLYYGDVAVTRTYRSKAPILNCFAFT